MFRRSKEEEAALRQGEMTSFFRFPRTPHLAWLGAGRPRDDKVLTLAEAQELMENPVVVEEKVDGANLGFSVDEHGTLRAQNRGRYLDFAALQDQWKPLKLWLSTRRDRLADALFPDLMLFGEWCYAVHSVRYAHLPDWFLGFDVLDRSQGVFWSVDRRNELAHQLDVAVVPELGRGHFSLGGLTELLGESRLTVGPAEGLYLRWEAERQLLQRAKLVRAEFVNAIEQHWSKRRLEENVISPNPHRGAS